MFTSCMCWVMSVHTARNHKTWLQVMPLFKHQTTTRRRYLRIVEIISVIGFHITWDAFFIPFYLMKLRDTEISVTLAFSGISHTDFIGISNNDILSNRHKLCILYAAEDKRKHSIVPSVDAWRPDMRVQVKLSLQQAVEAHRVVRRRGSTFSKQSAHRWRWGRQPYAPAALCVLENSWYSFLLKAESLSVSVHLFCIYPFLQWLSLAFSCR
jgi:hypothetical protein